MTIDYMTTTEDLRKLTRVRGFVASGAALSIRVAAELSLREMASAAEISPSTLWRWEHGQRRPSGDAALRYSELLDDLMTTRR